MSTNNDNTTLNKEPYEILHDLVKQITNNPQCKIIQASIEPLDQNQTTLRNAKAIVKIHFSVNPITNNQRAGTATKVIIKNNNVSENDQQNG